MKQYRPDTTCIHAGYTPGNGEPRVLPIVQSTTYTYDSSKEMGDLFDLKADGFFYTRLGNPTLDAVEKKLAALEGGVGALVTSSGQAATMMAVLNICHAGGHVVCSSAVYGGTFNLFYKTLHEMGIDCTFVSPNCTEDELNAAFRENTRCVFAETLTNPSLVVTDLEMFANAAHAHGVPCIVDNTFPTPINCRPFEFGVDIVTHSTTKYLDGHAVQLGGAIVDSGNFDWNNGKFPEFTEPDESYHGIVYAEHFGKAAYIAKARCHLMRDIGAQAAPMNAFYLNLGMETLALRMERHCSNAQKIAEFRAQQKHYVSESFTAIIAYRENAAMMHYAPLPQACSTIERENMLLNDSGGQYLEGTTDTTRTFAVGPITDEERRDFTNALKGVIALSRQRFLAGSTGSDLDTICRGQIWKEGLNYRCGTGHGVGFFLNVHEAPPNFRDRTVALEEGMFITIEPGVYTEGSHGVRTENAVVVVKDIQTEYGQFYRFDTFTLVPIDTSCLDLELMTDDELQWLNDYHQKVYQQVAPLVSERAKNWLEQKTQPVTR